LLKIQTSDLSVIEIYVISPLRSPYNHIQTHRYNMDLLFFVQKVNNNSKTVYSNFDFDELKFLEKLAVNEFISEKYKKI